MNATQVSHVINNAPNGHIVVKVNDDDDMQIVDVLETGIESYQLALAFLEHYDDGECIDLLHKDGDVVKWKTWSINAKPYQTVKHCKYCGSRFVKFSGGCDIGNDNYSEIWKCGSCFKKFERVVRV